MKVILHDLDFRYDELIGSRCDRVLAADGKYAPCQGCFGCWTRHPAECFMKDKLKQVCRIIGHADELVIITRNLYGEYSPAVKNVLDRSIGTSTPFSTYRGKQMHHTLRYGKHDLWKVIIYGEISDPEKDTFRYRAERNAINDGFSRSEVVFLSDLGVLFYLARMGTFIGNGTVAGKKYTRILIPSFIFILFADIFFIIVSLFEGGIFRGWLAKKDLEEDFAYPSVH